MQVDAIPPLPDNKGLSVGELKSILQHHLRENGSLRQLKAQLRTMVVTELLQNNGKNEKNEKVSKQKEKKEEKTENENKENMTLEVFESLRRAPHSDNNNTTMSGRIADSLIENHLRRSRRNLSLSIFTTEVEVLPLSEVGSPSCDERYLAQLLLPAPYNETENENRIQTKNEYKEIENRSFKSVLQRLVELQLKYTNAEGVAKIKEHTHHCGTQTESGTTNSDSALTSLECRLAAVDAKYALAFSQINRRSIIRFENGNNNNNNDDIAPFVATPSQVEKRIAQYKIDIYEQLKLEFDRKYEEFKNNEINRIREEAQEQYNVLARHKNEEFRELERTLIIKSEQEKKRLDYMRQDVEHQRLLLEKRQREVSESLLQHDDEISKCDERERKLKNKISELQLLVNKWEDVSAGRLVEIDAIRSRERSKVEEMRRMQAEFAAELRLKEESISRLRYRIRTPHPPTGAGRGGRGRSRKRNGQ
ncbi:hypothetical protein ADEAN_000439900 [Angomonas deanei]|uniref:Uncharacterized protein n=1 Tax=Angomonas deanei TaxID=59799 RepID=A0A7G2CD29_9TRYP|nr:hypothetical protein ADEAN_000439900 [Angomonas deanei]